MGGTTSWTSPISGYNSFGYSDNRIYCGSNSSDTTDVSYGIYQTVAISGVPVLGATLSAWRRYESVSATTHDGHVTSTVQIKKPDATIVTLATETKTGETGEGYILSVADIKSILSADGNYDIRLISTVASGDSNVAGSVSAENPYGSWTNSGMTLYGNNCYVTSNSGDRNDVSGYVEKSIVTSAAASSARISLDAMRTVYQTDPGGMGHGLITVTLTKSGGATTTLYDGDIGNDSWTTILNNVDVSSYMTTAGTYTLRLYGLVESGYVAPDYQQSTVYFGSCSLYVSWDSHTYTPSWGVWDNISLNVVSSVGTTNTTQANLIDLIDQAEAFVVSADTQMTALCSIGYLFDWSGESDNGTPYSCYWRSKDLDYAEVLGPDAHNILKTVDRIKLIYEDLSASVPISVYVSVDGGTTWVTKTANIGTGDGATKHYTFDFCNMDIVTGYFHTFKIESYSSTLKFKWLSMEVDFVPRGIFFALPGATAGM